MSEPVAVRIQSSYDVPNAADRAETSRAAISRTLLLALAAYLVCYFAFWTLEALLLHEEPHGDDLEQLLWAAHPALGYSKHPPLPSLVLAVVEQVIPVSIALVYWMGAACVALAMLFASKVANATLGRSSARIAILAMTCITFYTERMHLYNNNTAILVANAAAMLCVWRAVASNRKFWWLALGIAWGAGMLSKYQMVVAILCNVVFVVVADQNSVRSRIAGVSIAALVAAVLFAPHVVWLFQNDFPTFHYASTEVLAHLPIVRRPDNILRFVADEAWRTVPAILLLRAIYATTAREDARSNGGATADTRVRRFWLIHAWGPIAAMCLLTAFGGVALQMHWGTAFLWVTPFWFLSTDSGRRIGNASFAHALGCAAGVQTLLVLVKLVWPAY